MLRIQIVKCYVLDRPGIITAWALTTAAASHGDVISLLRSFAKFPPNCLMRYTHQLTSFRCLISCGKHSLEKISKVLFVELTLDLGQFVECKHVPCSMSVS